MRIEFEIPVPIKQPGIAKVDFGPKPNLMNVVIKEQI